MTSPLKRRASFKSRRRVTLVRLLVGLFLGALMLAVLRWGDTMSVSVRCDAGNGLPCYIAMDDTGVSRWFFHNNVNLSSATTLGHMLYAVEIGPSLLNSPIEIGEKELLTTVACPHDLCVYLFDQNWQPLIAYPADLRFTTSPFGIAWTFLDGVKQ
jgi:hypothetical protein